LMYYFSFSGWTGTDSIKNASRHLTPNLYFASSRICGSCSALRCVRGMKRQCTIFLARVGPVGIPEKGVETQYAKLLFLHPMGYVGHVVHFGASGGRNIDTLFFLLGGIGMDSTKMCLVTLCRTCVFASGCIWVM
jgi:hypothetical protein